MRCGKCGTDNREGRRFCAECGGALNAQCTRCGASNEPGEKFCGQCGAALAAGGAPSTGVAPVIAAAVSAISLTTESAVGDIPEGERKTVTALFADIKGSMELMEDLDPEDARAIVDPALRLMMDAARRYDGYIVQSTGDGIFALFGAPVAHEDHPQRALYAALRLQEDLKRYSDRLRQQGKLPLQARVGVNTGEAVVRRILTGEAHSEYAPISHSTGLAARMQTLAPVGSIAVTDATRKLCSGYFTFKSLGTTQVKGVSEPVAVHEVTGLGPLRTRLQVSAQRGLTKFVGRRGEIEQMAHALALARQGHGQIVAAMGEPGVGKSRLFYEFKATALSGCAVLETFSVSHGKASAYLPLIDLLKNYFKIAPEDDERARREKVIGKVLALDRTLEDALPYLFSLAGVAGEDDLLAQDDAQIKRRRTQEAVKRIILRESLNQALVLIVEDLHWIDAETQAVMNLLVDSIGNARVLLLVNYRPEYRHDWGSRTCYTQLRLDPLGRESAQEMLSTLLAIGPPLPDQPGSGPPLHDQSLSRDSSDRGRESGGVGIEALKRLIIERTEGNPFFMEEIVQGLFEQGTLARNGAVRLTTPVAEIKIPSTVQGILAARIDRLPPAEKELLQTLAVIGRQFPLGLVRGVSGKPDDELERMVGTLRLGEFIYEQPAMGDVEYRFKHALTQEVAYNSVLGERRKAIHLRAAAAIESSFAGRLEDYYAELAHHYVRGADHRKAVHYLSLAAQQELERAAYPQALEHSTTGFDLLAALPDDLERAAIELDLAFVRATALFVLKGPGEESAKYAARACELARQLDRPRDLSRALGGLIVYEIGRGNRPTARTLAEEGIAIGQRLREPVYEAFHRAYLGLASHLTGDLSSARESLEQALATARSQPGSSRIIRAIKVNSLAPLGQVLWLQGFPDQALRRCREIFGMEQELSDPAMFGIALPGGVMAALLCGQRELAHEQVNRHAALMEQHRFSFRQTAQQAFLKGWVTLDSDPGEAIELMRKALAIWSANRYLVGISLFAPILARAYAMANQVDEGLRVIDEAFPLAEQFQDHIYEPELSRTRGELLMMRDKAAWQDAEDCMRQALALAASRNAKSLELRAAMSLARLLNKQSRREEARATLAEIYGWFTEGFDTADLKDAKTLLDELRA